MNVRLIAGIVWKFVVVVHASTIASRPAKLVTLPERFTAATATAVAMSPASTTPDSRIVHFRVCFLPSITLPSVADERVDHSFRSGEATPIFRHEPQSPKVAGRR